MQREAIPQLYYLVNPYLMINFRFSLRQRLELLAHFSEEPLTFLIRKKTVHIGLRPAPEFFPCR